MPKKEARLGCKVSGRILSVTGDPVSGGWVQIKSERGGVFAGSVYSRLTVRVAADRLGDFFVILPPSSAVGVYTFTIQGKAWRVRVPDAEAADFADLVEAA